MIKGTDTNILFRLAPENTLSILKNPMITGRYSFRRILKSLNF